MNSKILEKKSNVPLILLGIYIILKPFYFFPSGNPQIADLVLVILALNVLIHPVGLRIVNIDISILLLLLLVIISLVSGVWAILLSDQSIIMPILFFLLNLMLFMIVLHIIENNENALQFIFWSVTIAVLLQILLLQISFAEFKRQELFFNNPNQLGYWSVLSAAMFLYLSQKMQISFILKVFFAAFVLIAAGLSLSKAAIISIVLLYLIYNSRNPIVIVLFIASLIGLVIFASEVEQVSNVIDRIASIGSSNDDNIEGRGFERLWKYPDYIWFGNAEGGYYRFENLIGIMKDSEIHSTLGMLFFSYGPLGISIFMLIFLRNIQKRGLETAIPFIPVFAYSMTHQGFRFSLFWLLLALVTATNLLTKQKDMQEGRDE